MADLRTAIKPASLQAMSLLSHASSCPWTLLVHGFACFEPVTHPLQQPVPGHLYARQCKQRGDLRGVLLQSAVAHPWCFLAPASAGRQDLVQIMCPLKRICAHQRDAGFFVPIPIHLRVHQIQCKSHAPIIRIREERNAENQPCPSIKNPSGVAETKAAGIMNLPP